MGYISGVITIKWDMWYNIMHRVVCACVHLFVHVCISYACANGSTLEALHVRHIVLD